MNKVSRIATVIATAAALLAASTSCSAFRSSTQTLNITCSHPDATLTVNDKTYTPPAQVTLKRNKDVSIQCYKKGFVPYHRTVGNHLNDTGVLDIIGTCLVLVPGIGLLTPGAWSLDETNIVITLCQE